LLEGKAGGLHGRTYHIALTLLYEYWRQGSRNPVKLPNGMLDLEGVSRYAKYRELNNLERRGLVTVQRRQRKSPLVTLLVEG
jgi:hypothetical protein